MTEEEFKAKNVALNTNLPYSEDTNVLGGEYKIGNKTVHNRFACQAMEGCDETFDGRPDKLTKRCYGRFAKGGTGIILFESATVLEEAGYEPLIIMQATHLGRYSKPQGEPAPFIAYIL